VDGVVERLPRFDVVEAQRVRLLLRGIADGGEYFAVRHERDLRHRVVFVILGDGHGQLPRRLDLVADAEQAHRAGGLVIGEIGAADCQELAVRRQPRRAPGVLELVERVEGLRFAGANVPQADLFVGGGDDVLAVGREGHAAQRLGVAFERGLGFHVGRGDREQGESKRNEACHE
jgi:hypothetical protein